MSLTLQHTRGGNASPLRCPVHGKRTRVSAQAGGLNLLESINNANTLCHPGSEPRGVILLGDSAGAHFHIPPKWITASQMSLVSNVGSNRPGCAGLCVCFPSLSLNVMPTRNRCKFSCSAKSAKKGASFSIQCISNNVISNVRHRHNRLENKRQCVHLSEKGRVPLPGHTDTLARWGSIGLQHPWVRCLCASPRKLKL